MLSTEIHKRVCISGDAHLQEAGVTWSGRMVRRRQRHHSGLWCDVFTTELNVKGRTDSRSLTARKHTVKSRKRRENKCHPASSGMPFLMTSKNLADLSHLPQLHSGLYTGSALSVLMI